MLARKWLAQLLNEEGNHNMAATREGNGKDGSTVLLMRGRNGTPRLWHAQVSHAHTAPIAACLGTMEALPMACLDSESALAAAGLPCCCVALATVVVLSLVKCMAAPPL